MPETDASSTEDSSRPFISVVIPARDAAHLLGEQLNALTRQTDPGVEWEVIVADNGSTDNTRDFVMKHADTNSRIRYVNAGRAPGANVARNVGTAAAEGTLIAVCDADDAVAPDWLLAYVTAYEEFGADLMGGRVAPLLGPSGRTFGRSTNPFDQTAPRPMSFLPMASGANMCFVKCAWAKISGFDESWGLTGGDDVDFSWRMQLAGCSFLFLPEATVHYRFRPERAKSLKQAFDYSVASPKLYERFRSAGAQRRSVAGALSTWVVLAMSVWRLLGPTDSRDRWLHQVAKNAGYFVGSWRFRVFYP